MTYNKDRGPKEYRWISWFTQRWTSITIAFSRFSFLQVWEKIRSTDRSKQPGTSLSSVGLRLIVYFHFQRRVLFFPLELCQWLSSFLLLYAGLSSLIGHVSVVHSEGASNRPIEGLSCRRATRSICLISNVYRSRFCFDVFKIASRFFRSHVKSNRRLVANCWPAPELCYTGTFYQWKTSYFLG